MKISTSAESLYSIQFTYRCRHCGGTRWRCPRCRGRVTIYDGIPSARRPWRSPPPVKDFGIINRMTTTTTKTMTMKTTTMTPSMSPCRNSFPLDLLPLRPPRRRFCHRNAHAVRAPPPRHRFHRLRRRRRRLSARFRPTSGCHWETDAVPVLRK